MLRVVQDGLSSVSELSPEAGYPPYVSETSGVATESNQTVHRNKAGRKPDPFFVANMDRYEGDFLMKGGKLPAKASRDGSLSISWTALSEDLNMPLPLLIAHHIHYRRRADGWGRTYGLEERAAVRVAPLSIDEFALMVLAHREQELQTCETGSVSAEGNISGLVEVLRWVAKKDGRAHGVRSSLQFSLSDVIRAGAPPNAANEIKVCLALLDNWHVNKDLPRNPAHLLRYAMARAGVTAAAIERDVGISASSISTWKDGKNLPLSTRWRVVSELEAYLDLPERAFRDAVAEVQAQQRLEMAHEARSYGRACELRISLPYCHHDWSASLEEEFDQWSRFRTTYFLEDMDRAGREWRPATLLMARSYLSMVYGTFTTPLNEKFHIPKDDLTIAYLVFPALIKVRLKFMMDRMQFATGMKKPGLSAWELDRLNFVRSLLHKETGWLAQMPGLADRLKPVIDDQGNEIVTAAEIAIAKADWKRACKKASKKYFKLQKSHARFVVSSRNPHECVVPILSMDNPLEAFAMLCESVKRKEAAVAGDAEALAFWLREMVITGIMTQAAFRVLTLSSLDLEHLVFDEATRTWSLIVPSVLFKNFDGAYFGSQGRSTRRPLYKRVLEDVYGLYDAIERYLAFGRQSILGTTKTDALLVSLPHKRGGVRAQQSDCECGRATASHLRRLIKEMTAEHLGFDADGGRGIPGITRFPAQAFRYILATGVLKTSKAPSELERWKQAADSIHDGLLTVAIYVQYLPDDRRAAVEHCIADGLKMHKLKLRPVAA
jgi:hypothetical protein